ncbi:SDR family NAD(P)-dependent oxidoreductase [Hyphomicrobium sp.]|uniref:SDR family NAD(P)-dependent oxidoreductase n=1 Tax=Hyphomicrobium sp. TaxID=82 RepID=UPI002FDE7DDF
MSMSVIARACDCVALPELAGCRVLVTGLTTDFGFDVARSFADRGARLIVQSPDAGPALTELATLLADNAREMHLFDAPLDSEADAARLVQTVAQELGGIDAMVNLACVERAFVDGLETPGDVERLVSEVLRLPLRLTEVAANRMRLVWREGVILNAVRMSSASGGRAMMLADVLRAELAALTRGLAREWAEHGISINAVAPPSSVAVLTGETEASEADLAAVAIELASRKGRGVSGHVLDATGSAGHCC